MTFSHRRQPTFVLLAQLVVLLLVGVFWPTGESEARPLLTPCSYDNTCITTTVRRTFEPLGELSKGGRKATVYAHIPCVSGEHFRVEVRLTQGDVTALGFRAGTCGRSELWPVAVTTSGGETLTAGQAHVCGTAETHRNNELTSGQSWCRTVTIVA